ncbi:hypothetical protein ACVIHC_002241 [Bradyrhizobium diazoefficiens]
METALTKDHNFLHRLYLAAATVTGFGGLAMTAAILSGDVSNLQQLVAVYAHAFEVGAAALMIYAVGKNRED